MSSNLKLLEDLVYDFYPINLDHTIDRRVYENSEQFKRLQVIRELKLKEETDPKLENLNKNIASIDEKIKFRDMTRDINSFDVSYNFQWSFFLDGFFYKIILLESFVLPIYFMRFFYCEDVSDSVFGPPLIYKPDKKVVKIEQILREIEKYYNDKLFMRAFPKEYYSHIMPDISYGDIRFGRFTIFNALFQNQDVYFEKA